MALKNQKALANDDYEQPINPEIDARLNQYIKDTPKLHAHYSEMPKELLVRKLMLNSMKRHDYKAGEEQKLVAWVERNPEIKARVEARIRTVSPERQARAFINVAKDELQAHTLRQSQPPPVAAPSPGVGLKP